MDWGVVASYGATFILGTVAGIYGTAKGTYLANKWTAEKAERDYRKKVITAFQNCEAKMPALFAEMRDDLKKQPLKTRFTLLTKATSHHAGPMSFVYHYDVHEQLQEKISLLVSNDLVLDCSSGYDHNFVMDDNFIKLLKATTKEQAALPKK